MKSGVLDEGNATAAGGPSNTKGGVVVTSTEAPAGGSDGAKGQAAFNFGSDMPKDVQLSEEQLVQLAKLREEARKAK